MLSSRQPSPRLFGSVVCDVDSVADEFDSDSPSPSSSVTDDSVVDEVSVDSSSCSLLSTNDSVVDELCVDASPLSPQAAMEIPIVKANNKLKKCLIFLKFNPSLFLLFFYSAPQGTFTHTAQI